MFFLIQGKPFYLDREITEKLTYEVLKGKSCFDYGRELFGKDAHWIDIWDDVLSQLYKLLKIRLVEEASKSRDSFFAKYSNFKYEGEEACRNIIGILHSFCLATGQAHVLPIASSLSADIHNRIVKDVPFAHPIAEQFYFEFDAQQQSWISRLFKRKFSTSIHISCNKVRYCQGTLAHFYVLVGTALIECGHQITIDLAPGSTI